MSELPTPNDEASSSEEEENPASPGGQAATHTKHLIELLKIAEVMGVITGWSVSGQSIVLRREEANILVRAVDAGALLVRLMGEESDRQGHEGDH